LSSEQVKLGELVAGSLPADSETVNKFKTVIFKSSVVYKRQYFNTV